MVPISNRTGVLEWINNTVPLKELIEKNLPDNKGISKSRATIEMRKWLQKVDPKGNIIKVFICRLYSRSAYFCFEL